MDRTPPGNGKGSRPGEPNPQTRKADTDKYHESPGRGQENSAGAYESRRNHAACFQNRDKREDWMADFTGCVVLEDGQKFFVNVYERKTRNGDRYLSVALRPKTGGKRP